MINALVVPLGTSLGDVRDRALLLIGFAGALRRSELVALDVDDITEDDEGLVVVLRRSKVDQEAASEMRDPESHPQRSTSFREDQRSANRGIGSELCVAIPVANRASPGRLRSL